MNFHQLRIWSAVIEKNNFEKRRNCENRSKDNSRQMNEKGQFLKLHGFSLKRALECAVEG